MRIDGLQGLIGKQITGIISIQDRRTGPRDQLFLLLDDDTHYEIYGPDLGWSGHAHPGGRDALMKTLRPGDGNVAEIGAAEHSGE